jgi:hypothetical protein
MPRPPQLALCGSKPWRTTRSSPAAAPRGRARTGRLRPADRHAAERARRTSSTSSARATRPLACFLAARQRPRPSPAPAAPPPAMPRELRPALPSPPPTRRAERSAAASGRPARLCSRGGAAGNRGWVGRRATAIGGIFKARGTSCLPACLLPACLPPGGPGGLVPRQLCSTLPSSATECPLSWPAGAR